MKSKTAITRGVAAFGAALLFLSDNFILAENTDAAANINLGAKTIRNQETTVFVSYQGSDIVIQVSVSQPKTAKPIYFDDVTVKAYANDNTEIPVRQVAPQLTAYGQLPSNAVGAYIAILGDGKTLKRITVQRGEEIGTFLAEN